MTAAAIVDEELARRRAKKAEQMRRWRSAGASLGHTKRVNTGDDIGPAIAEGEPFTDDFDWCDAEWARLLAGARFVDVEAPRF